MRGKTVARTFVFAFVVMAVLGFIYPTVVSLVTENALPWQSEGSPVTINGTVYGTEYLAEAFNSSLFFQPRPSATGYNLSISGSSSLSPNDPAYLNLTEQYLKQFLEDNPGINVSQVPYSMVAPSDSGLDPNIPVLGAFDQVPRIARSLSALAGENNVTMGVNSTESFLNQTIIDHEAQNFPLFGSYYVNTVTLNFIIIKMLMEKGILPAGFLS